MSDTLLRQWVLLRAIPRFPKKIEVQKLLSTLESAGYSTSIRTMQRDLNSLSRVFPLICDDKSIPYGWSWDAKAQSFDLPSMDLPTALTLRMIEQFIPSLMPAVLLDVMESQFKRAKAILEANPDSPLGNWTDLVRVVPRGMPLLSPKFDEAAVRTVYDSLLAGTRFIATYRSRTDDEEAIRKYEVSPLGLIARGTLLYLICTLWNYQDIRQLAFHPVIDADPMGKQVIKPAEFDLDRYIEQGEFQYPVGPMVRLKLKMQKNAAAHLYETPLSEDQETEWTDAEHVEVSATVRETAQLKWWLRGFGDAVANVHIDALATQEKTNYD